MTHKTASDGLLTAMLADYTALEGEVDGIVATASTAFGAHATDANAILALLSSDFTTHKATAEGLLTGLGTTELARINEQFDNQLTVQHQALVDRGMRTDSTSAQ